MSPSFRPLCPPALASKLHRPVARFALAMAVASLALPAFAADIVKDNNAIDLTNTNSWIGGVVPGTPDVALFNSVLTSGISVNLGFDFSTLGLRVTNPAGAIVINDPTAGFKYTLADSGIDLTAATVPLTINATIMLNGMQSWLVGSSSSLTIGGPVHLDAFILTIGGSGNTSISTAMVLGTK